jgi:hypothetical protein
MREAVQESSSTWCVGTAIVKVAEEVDVSLKDNIHHLAHISLPEHDCSRFHMLVIGPAAERHDKGLLHAVQEAWHGAQMCCESLELCCLSAVWPARIFMRGCSYARVL